MLPMQNFLIRYVCAAAVALLLVAPPHSAIAHEAWFITGAEMDAIIAKPAPEIFSTYGLFSVFTILFSLIFIAGLICEPIWRNHELHLMAPMRKHLRTIADISLSWSLAIMMLIAAFGLLPIMGTEGGDSTLFVSSTILDKNSWWAPVLMAMQVVLAIMLISGFQTRLAACGVILLAACGHIVFGWKFIDFSLHFIAPALILLASGQGTRLIFTERRDCLLQQISNYLSFENAYRIARIMTGLGFILLAINYKFLKPGLILEILDMTVLPDLGDLAEPIALLMALIEVFAGLALVLGVLVRPVSLFLLFAFTVFTLILNEAVFYHTQLYALAFVFFAGGADPRENPSALPHNDRRQQSWTPSYTTAHSGVFVATALFLIFAVPLFNQRASALNSAFELADTNKAPAVRLAVTQDRGKNWWLQIETENFEFSNNPQKSCGEAMCGHFHIMLNGKKLAMAMQPIVLLGKLSPGKHMVAAQMRTANHQQVKLENKPIVARIEVQADRFLSQQLSVLTAQ